MSPPHPGPVRREPTCHDTNPPLPRPSILTCSADLVVQKRGQKVYTLLHTCNVARQELAVRRDVEAVGIQYRLPSVLSGPACQPASVHDKLPALQRCGMTACLVGSRPVRCSRHAAPVVSDTGLEYATRISIALGGRLLPTEGYIPTPPPRAVCGQAPPCLFLVPGEALRHVWSSSCRPEQIFALHITAVTPKSAVSPDSRADGESGSASPGLPVSSSLYGDCGLTTAPRRSFSTLLG